MAGIITRFIREYIIIISIIIFILGWILFILGVLWAFFIETVQDTIMNDLGYTNYYVLVAGLILWALGAYYLFSFHKKRKFILEEIQTSKRSEFLKKHKKLKNTVKYLPTKYQQMVKEKEKELKI